MRRGLGGDYFNPTAVCYSDTRAHTTFLFRTDPGAITGGIAALAEFAAVARSPVVWDRQNDIDLIPDPEAPGRLAKQLVLFTRALAVVRGEREVSLPTYFTTMQVAQDTMPAQRRLMLEAIVDPLRQGPPTTTDVAEATAYPTTTARRYLQELTAVGLVSRLPGGSGHPDRWEASDKLTGLRVDTTRPLDAEKQRIPQEVSPAEGELTRRVREERV